MLRFFDRPLSLIAVLRLPEPELFFFALDLFTAIFVSTPLRIGLCLRANGIKRADELCHVVMTQIQKVRKMDFSLDADP